MILFAFTETSVFTEDLHDLADDETLFEIQRALLDNPMLGDIIKGTNGARKGRIANRRRNTGKRGGFRFVYVYLEHANRIFLLAIYDKREVVDLSPEQAKLLGEVVRRLKKAYGENDG